MGKGKKDPKSKRRKKRRMNKILKITIAVIVIIIVLVIGLWGMHSSTSYLTVSEIVENKSKYLDEYVEVKGTVKDDSVDKINKTFIITDGDNDLLIDYNRSLPSNFEEGGDVIIKGTLRDDGEAESRLFIKVKEIVVSCPSKY